MSPLFFAVPTLPTDDAVRYRGLEYPFGRNQGPEPSAPVQIAEGVYWARFPMPMSLDHINIWLLEDGEGWTVVDTCLALPNLTECAVGCRKRFEQSPN